ncbi:LAFA_0E19680g1_1 [Lachancea sp. 'fantastica']|nr:LAFA_0E19680g1_1 [Lachancea sp. 'fantastica']
MVSKDLNLVHQLHQELRYIILIYHRNKNQHRMAIWWRHFNELKRSAGQVLTLIQKDKLKKPQAIMLWSLLEKLRKRQLPRMYYSFNGVVGLGQFVTLGVVLIGILAKINALYNDIFENYKPDFESAGLLKKTSAAIPPKISSTQMGLMADEELGEEIEIQEQVSHTEQPEHISLMPPDHSVRTPDVEKKTKNKKSKKKKKSSAMDAIFG